MNVVVRWVARLFLVAALVALLASCEDRPPHLIPYRGSVVKRFFG